MRQSKLRAAVLASGNGTNFQALVDACTSGYAPAEVACLVTNRKDARVVDRANAAGVEVVAIRHRDRSTEEVDQIILKAFEKRGIEAAFNAGYMRIRGPAYCKALDGRAFNIHPSLLPAFPGAAPIQDAWDWGVKVSGVTVHYATEDLDMGPIVVQRVVEVADADTLESFEHKIHLAEYAIYPKVLKMQAEGLLRLEGRRAVIEGDVADPPWAGELPPGLRDD
jgi:phosphoribosylglycinamide formyltransferase-1